MLLGCADWVEWGTGDTLWSRIWCQVVPNAWNLLAVVGPHIHLLLHLHLHPVVVLRIHTDLAASGAPSSQDGRTLPQVSDSRPLRVRFPAMHAEVSPDPNRGDSPGRVLRGSTGRPCRLDLRHSPCHRPWVQRHSALRIDIVVDIFRDVGTLREVL